MSICRKYTVFIKFPSLFKWLVPLLDGLITNYKEN